jgi:transcriptional regulator with XRE-family HTH domain
VARKPTPTLRRRELGARLRQLRQDAHRTAEDIASELMVSPTKITRMETGARGITLRDVRDLCDVYGVSDVEREHLMGLAKQSREPSWWQQFDLPYSTYAELEASASAIADYKSDVIPGLLQTEDYAHAVLEATLPDPSADRLAHMAESRHARRDLLTGDQPVRLWTVIDEAALRRVVGGPDIMHEQIRAIIEQAARPNIEVQVLPFVAGAHPALNSTFVILQFDQEVPDVVYVEGMLGPHYLESPTDLARYRHTFDQLRAIASSPKDSLALLAAIAETFAGHQGRRSTKKMET